MDERDKKRGKKCKEQVEGCGEAASRRDISVLVVRGVTGVLVGSVGFSLPNWVAD